MTRKAPCRHKGGPNAIDAHVGSRIRQLRLERGWSQEKLGEAMELSFQQIQKYERGINRIGPGRLWMLGITFNVPVGYFFDGMTPTMARIRTPIQLTKAAEKMLLERDEHLGQSHRETYDVIKLYNAIKDPDQRRHIRSLMKSMSKAAA